MTAPTRQHGPGGFATARCSRIHRRSTALFAEATPIWLAALIASCCRATCAGAGETVSWKSVSGKALYTNAGADTEFIHPLGVALQGGQTLAVSWMPGDTAYTVEILQ